MSDRLYSLVTRSTALLILALLAAPVWDSWRYRGLASSGGAAFPVGAIMSPPRRAPSAPVAGAASTAVPPATSAAADSVAALQPALGPWNPPARSATPPAARPIGSTFDAWTARAQVDPFWNGETAAPAPAGARPGSPDADETAAVDTDLVDPDGVERAGTDADPADDAGIGTGIERGRSAKGRGEAEEADLDGSEPIERSGEVDAAHRSAESGLMGAFWPAPSAEAALVPEPMPDPAPAAAVAVTSRVGSPVPSPGDPKPTPVATPLVTAQTSASEVAPGEILLVAIRIEHAQRMTSLPFHLVFDPAVIEFTGSQAGSALASHDPVLLASVSPNRPGDLAVGLSLIETSGAFTGSGEVVTLLFRALAPGQSNLSFSRATLRGARSESVDVHFSDGFVIVR